ncbi:MAG: TetR/AcrR family transcriptional regulator [Peptococcaceae bacterium]|nr:TetR/AcrR family transcriptional regulator [Peptococcaceae bacterium]
MVAISLRENRKKELKEEIFRQAVNMFKERGFQNVTIEDITTACGIAKGTFYNYFSKKEHILLYLGQTQLETLKESMVLHAGVKNLRERLRLIFLDLVARIDKDPDLVIAATIETMKSSVLKEELELEEEAHRALIPLFEEGIRNGQVSGRWSPDHLSSIAVGIYHQVILTWLQKAEYTDPAAVYDAYLDVLWNGIGNRKGEVSG